MRLDTLARIQLARGACNDALQSWDQALKNVPAPNRAEISRAADQARAQCKS